MEPLEELRDERSERELISSTQAYHGWVWDVRQDSFKLNSDGEPLTRDYIAHPGAVAVLVLNEDNEVLLLRQYRHPARMNMWEIPAGLLDVPGESYLAAAQRELFEEADLRAKTWHVLVDFFNSPGSSSEAIRVYVAQDLEQVPVHERHERGEEEAEMIYQWVPLPQAVQAVMQGRLHNPSAVLGILAANALGETGFSQLRPADAPWPEHQGARS